MQNLKSRNTRRKKRIQYNFSGSLAPSVVLVAAFWTTVFIFVIFEKNSKVQSYFRNSESFVLRLRCYRNVNKS